MSSLRASSLQLYEVRNSLVDRSPPKSAGFTDYESDSDIDDPDAAAEQASMDLWMQRVNALYTQEQLIELTNGL